MWALKALPGDRNSPPLALPTLCPSRTLEATHYCPQSARPHYSMSPQSHSQRGTGVSAVAPRAELRAVRLYLPLPESGRLDGRCGLDAPS